VDFISLRAAAISASRPTTEAALFGRPCLRRRFLVFAKILFAKIPARASFQPRATF
jgi:hypothetical protein